MTLCSTEGPRRASATGAECHVVTCIGSGGLVSFLAEANFDVAAGVAADAPIFSDAGGASTRCSTEGLGRRAAATRAETHVVICVRRDGLAPRLAETDSGVAAGVAAEAAICVGADFGVTATVRTGGVSCVAAGVTGSAAAGAGASTRGSVEEELRTGVSTGGGSEDVVSGAGADAAICTGGAGAA